MNINRPVEQIDAALTANIQGGQVTRDANAFTFKARPDPHDSLAYSLRVIRPLDELDPEDIHRGTDAREEGVGGRSINSSSPRLATVDNLHLVRTLSCQHLAFDQVSAVGGRRWRPPGTPLNATIGSSQGLKYRRNMGAPNRKRGATVTTRPTFVMVPRQLLGLR